MENIRFLLSFLPADNQSKGLFLLSSSEPHDFSVCITWLIDKSKCLNPRLVVKVFVRERLRLRKFQQAQQVPQVAKQLQLPQVQPAPAVPQLPKAMQAPQAPVALQAGNGPEAIQTPQAPQWPHGAACGEDLVVNVWFYVRGLPIGLLGPQLSCVSVCFEM